MRNAAPALQTPRAALAPPAGVRLTMPSILTEEDKQTVKRTVPKASNKIHAVAVSKLYVAHPNHQRWTYTGLQGAAVLANDLVGNTFWIKLVDISVRPSVPWDRAQSCELIGDSPLAEG